MAKTVMCRIIPTKSQKFSGANQSNGVVILEIHSAGGGSRRLTIARSHDLKLNFGDVIKCVSGAAAVMINPGTLAGTFLLRGEAESGSSGKARSELEINEETTKHTHRGKISVADDIGTVLTGGTATTR